MKLQFPMFVTALVAITSLSASAIGGISYDLLSDYHPHGAVAREYGVLREDGLAERALFVIDKHGVIRWTKLHTIPEHPEFDELIEAIRKL